MCTGKKIRSMSLGQDHELWDSCVFEDNVNCDLEPIMIGFYVTKNILNYCQHYDASLNVEGNWT